MATPLVSVIMPVYNNADTVVAAGRSILDQTVDDLELIIIDDGSTDDSYEMASQLRDPRVRLFRNRSNLGVSKTRNRGLDLMKGQYMAPMDSDDVCYPRRLELTLNILHSNPETGVCGGWALWKGWGGRSFVARLPWGPEAVRAYLLYGMPAPHDTLLFRSSVLRDSEVRYSETSKAAVDYDFYRKCARVTGVDNVPAVLMEYRCNLGGISNTRASEATSRRMAGLREELEKLLSDPIDDATLRLHARVGNGTGAQTVQDLEAYRLWLEKLVGANRNRQVYTDAGLAKATAMVWFCSCRNSAHLGLAAWRAWRTSRWSCAYSPPAGELVSFAGTWFLSQLMPSRRKAQGALSGL